MAFVFSYPNAFIYVNGSLIASKIATGKPSNIKRTLNFIGAGSFANVKSADAIIDELKIFSRGLSESEVNYDTDNRKYL